MTEPEILVILRPMTTGYGLESEKGEYFGDLVIRAGVLHSLLRI